MPARSWCSFWGDAQRDRFTDSLAKAVYDHYGGADCEIDEELGLVHVEGVATFDLGGAARTCRTVPPDGWFDILSLGSAILVEANSAAEAPRDWAGAETQLRLKVTAGAGPEVHRANDSLSEELPLGLSATVVVPHPDGGDLVVDRRMLQQWGVEEGTAVEAATANTIADGPLQESDDPQFPGQFRVLTGPPASVTGLLCHLERVVGPLGPLGAAVSAPSADTVLVCPIDDTDPACLDNVTAMMVSGHSRYSCAPEPNSPNVLWHRPGGALEPLARMEHPPFEMVHHRELAAALSAGRDGRPQRTASRTEGPQGLDL